MDPQYWNSVYLILYMLVTWINMEVGVEVVVLTCSRGFWFLVQIHLGMVLDVVATGSI